jgi:hypothetical protein
VERPLYAPGVPGCDPNAPDFRPVQFVGKTNLPGDWTENQTSNVFMLLPGARWKKDMDALRALAESWTAGGAEPAQASPAALRPEPEAPATPLAAKPDEDERTGGGMRKTGTIEGTARPALRDRVQNGGKTNWPKSREQDVIVSLCREWRKYTKDALDTRDIALQPDTHGYKQPPYPRYLEITNRLTKWAREEGDEIDGTALDTLAAELMRPDLAPLRAREIDDLWRECMTVLRRIRVQVMDQPPKAAKPGGTEGNSGVGSPPPPGGKSDAGQQIDQRFLREVTRAKGDRCEGSTVVGMAFAFDTPRICRMVQKAWRLWPGADEPHSDEFMDVITHLQNALSILPNEWQATGEPPPRDRRDIERLLALIGRDDVVVSGEWTPAGIAPMLIGGLQRRREQREGTGGAGSTPTAAKTEPAPAAKAKQAEEVGDGAAVLPNEGDAAMADVAPASVAAPQPKVEHVVILIHGIRDFGAWHQKVEQALGSDAIRVVMPKYGWFGPLKFIAPLYTRSKPLARIKQAFDDAAHAFPNANISAIAHSFGAYLLTELLLKEPYIKVSRVVLCGAVVRQDFPWERVQDQLGSLEDRDKAKYVVNHCGNKDIWPVIGASAHRRYGNAGTDGFGSVYVTDRFHKGGHGLFFTKTFIQKHWKPFIEQGTIVHSDAVQGEGVPCYVRLLQKVPFIPQLTLALLTVAAIGIILALLKFVPLLLPSAAHARSGPV